MLIAGLACSTEPLEPDEAPIEPRENAPCGPNHTLEKTDCELDLLPGEPKPFIYYLEDGEEYDGYAWATVGCLGDCACEYVTSGKKSGQTASCEFLGGVTPEGKPGACEPVVRELGPPDREEFTAEGATAEEAESAAIEGCKEHLRSYCHSVCWGDTIVTVSPKSSISCCKPRQPGQNEADESGDSGSSGSGELPEDSDTTPVPIPGAG